MSHIRKIGVIGAGNMGSGIAQKFAQEGMPVVMVDTTDGFVRKGLAAVDGMLQEAVARKVFSPEQVARIKARIAATTDLNAVSDADLVIEAVFEDRAVKSELFLKLDSICTEKTILATNTSSFFVHEFADQTGRPDRFIGLHYFYHPAKNRLLEVVPHPKTSRETIERSLLAARLHGKTAIVVKDSPGFAVNRFFVPFLNEAARMLEEGAAGLATIEEAARRGFRIGMGPFELMNVTGIPIAVHAATTLGNELGGFYAPAAILQRQMKKGIPWDLCGEVEPGKIDPVIDRFYGVCLGVAAALVEEGVASIEDTDRGAKIGLRWGMGPFEIMNRIGIEKTCETVEALIRRYPGFGMPALLQRQRSLGSGFDFRFVDLDIKDGEAWITLNRPEAMNALNETVVKQLADRFTAALNAPDVRGIVFQGAGKAFVAGADIRYFIQKIKAGKISDIAAFTRQGHDLLLAIENCAKPTIALLDGPSLGGGSELALACQAIVATPAGSLAFPETGIGIYPGLGGMVRLARHIGKDLAKYFVLTGATLGAQDARTLGIVTRLVEPADAAAAVREQIFEGKPEKYRHRVIPEPYKLFETLFSEKNLQTIVSGGLPGGLDPESAAKIRKSLGTKAPLALRIANEIMEAQAGKSVKDAVEIELGRLEEIFSTRDALKGLSSLGKKRPEYTGS